MSNYYLFIIPPDDINRYFFFGYDKAPGVNLRHPAPHLQVEDKLLPLVYQSPTRQVILPFLYSVVYSNRTAGTVTLQLEEHHNYILDIATFTSIKISTIPPSMTIQISQKEFERIVSQMGGKYMDEKALLDYIQSYITARGYYFDQETLYNYHICLKTRPFVILAGLSGTGKSKLSQLYAEALGQREHYLRLPVRPNWNDDRYLLGHFNVITGDYMTEPAVEFMLKANEDPYNLYFFCLDEMNLAHVEYYFSQFLSAMEEDRPEDRKIRLLGERTRKQLEAQRKTIDIPDYLHIPINLFFTGTINVDETTQPISDKVIDRANTLEFFRVELDKLPLPSEPPAQLTLSPLTWQSYQVKTPDTSFRNQIVEISKILNRGDLGLGYRVLHEIELYLANSTNLLDSTVAFDLQVKQRILPRVRGSGLIKPVIEDLITYTKRNKLPRSEQRLDEMNSRLKRDGYTNFWR